MIKIIYVAGGCFWGVEAYFKQLKGVLDTKVGYANGIKDEISYQELKEGKDIHAETVCIEYNDQLISLEKILEHFLRFVDPYSVNKQGHDIGIQYRSGIYYIDQNDYPIIKKYFDDNIFGEYQIEILPLKNFCLAEDYHQDYLDKNPAGYCHVNLNLIKEREKK